MKLNRISNEKAERIIVYGEDKAFTVFEFDRLLYTIYHRIYEGIYYDILEMVITNGKNINDEDYEEIQTFYTLDPEEVKLMFKTEKS